MWGKDVTEITGEKIVNTLLTYNKLKSATLLKDILLHECFSSFFIVQMVPNNAKHLMFYLICSSISLAFHHSNACIASGK